MYIQNLWTIRNPYGYRDQEFGVFSHNCTCRSLLRSGHVQEWAVDEAIDTLLKVHFLHLFGCQADFHCWCWLLLNIALRLQGLTLRHPERSWSQLAGSFHDSDSTLCRIFYKCRFATNNHFQSQADHCQPQSWNSSRGTWQESQAEETADELILWSQNQSRLRSTMYRKPDSNKKL